MTEDRRTRAQLIRELTRTQAELKTAADKLVAATQDDRTPEVRALDACVRALEPMKSRPSAATYGLVRTAPAVGIEWVLRAVADRYGVDLTREVVAPCQRQHADEMSLAQIADLFVRTTKPEAFL
ncbi:hypothetical protein [Microbacterium sp. 16-032]|uniref:hypothetical protein n=1 Tax=Microbacterium sp. 16-032 TaxID=3239808 RepID=UPI0034E1EB88